MNQDLHSDDQLTIANALVKYQIEHIRQTDNEVADRLKGLRELLWESTEPMEQTTKQSIVQGLLANLDDKQLEVLTSSFARMGEIYNLAGLTARDNYFVNIEADGKTIPGGIEEFLKEQPDLKTSLGKLGTPVFEQVLTMHPTGVMGLEPMKKLRNIALAIRKGDEEEVKAAVASYQDTPILHHNAAGNEVNMSVRDEVKVVMHCLENVYQDSTNVMDRFDKRLEKGYADEYEPLDLRLNARFASWAGGDKDGNNSVTAEVTLETLVRHTHEIVDKYAHDIGGMKDPLLGEWKEKLEGAQKSLAALLERAEALTDETNTLRASKDKSGDLREFGARFEEISHELADIRKGLDAKDLEGKLTEVYQQHGEEADKALDMVRKVRWFDFNFAKLEYRETAEEYSKVLGVLIDGYEDMSREQKAEAMTAALEGKVDGSKAKEILEKGTNRHLKEEGPEAIAYHTLRRMELARDHGDMIRDNVLAECGAIETFGYQVGKLAEFMGQMPEEGQKTALVKAINDVLNIPEGARLSEGQLTPEGEGALAAALSDYIGKQKKYAHEPDKLDAFLDDVKAAIPDYNHPIKGYNSRVDPTPEEVAQQGLVNMLEAKFLQKVVGANRDGKEGLLGIVPLFEDPSTMQNIDKIMAATYDNSAYKKHLAELAEDRHGGEVTQQVQIAHSDNRRRAGSLAGTAFIHEAHHMVRDLNNKYKIATQFYEGGSWTDAFRNGVRSITAQVNAYGLQDFAKFTVQGVSDLNAYLNHPGAIERLLTRQHIHSASKMGWNEADNKWEAVPYTNGSRTPNPVMDEVARNALKKTLADYSKSDFSKETIGIVMDALGLGYQREAEVANRGSRAAMRGGSKVQVGAIIEGIAVDKLRTIPFSAIQQLNRFTPSGVGAQNLSLYIYDELSDKLKELRAKKGEEVTVPEKEFLSVFQDVPVNKQGYDEKRAAVKPIHLKALYDGSPTFRDAIDKAAFAVARTDMDAVASNVMRNLNSPRVQDGEVRERGRAYLEILKSTYKKIGSIIYQSLLGQSDRGRNTPSKFRRYPEDSTSVNFADVQARAMEALQQAHSQEALDALNGMGPEIFRRNQFLDVFNIMKTQLDEDKKLGANDNILAQLTGAGLASVVGRFIEADDPAMTKRRHDEHAAGQQVA